VIAETAQRVVVMYAGKVVEEAPTAALFEDPLHPYTRGLLRSIPKLGERSGGRRRRLSEIPGMVPGLLVLPEGCPFHPRCPEVMAICPKALPDRFEHGPERRVRCWLYGERG
jgi:peptide/nickel transport system ATP-binding protein/oligopeptide transport system ATP-binding protein